MKHRILSIALVLVLCLSLSLNVFAYSSSDGGTMSGNTSITTSATLSVSKNYGTAKTSAGDGSLTFSTSITYYYINSSGQTVTSSDSGTTSAGAGTTLYNQGIKANSQHSVRGSGAGSWSCSLAADAS